MWTEDSIRAFWEANSASFSGDVTAREIVRLVKPYIAGRVLDVGAGSGALVRQIPGAIGVDIVPRHVDVMQGSIVALPFGDATFDTVFATDLLEHLPEDALHKGIQEIRRVLCPGGRLVVTVPYREDLAQNMACCPLCQAQFHRWGHLRRFDETVIWDVLQGWHIELIRVLPLALMAEHWLIRHFWRIFIHLGFCRASDMLLVAQR